MPRFTSVPHPHIAWRRAHGPPKVADEHAGLNGRIALGITVVVGSMICAYVFAALALISLPAALGTHDVIVIVAWVAQTFLQLVLLPIIIVGQNIQGRASDKRAEMTYADAEAVLHQCLQLEAHLQHQDAILSDLIAQEKDTSP